MSKRPSSEGAESLLGLYFPVLDHGFVSLVDYMGTDTCIERAARVSYGGGTRKVSETRGLLRYLRRHKHCYDANTEVLTRRGFVRWPDVNDEDQLGIWDPDAQSLCYEKPEYLTIDRYSGKMYEVNHKKINLLVTPEHSMYVDTKMWCPVRRNMFWSGSRRLVEAKDLGHSAMVRYFKTAPRHDLKHCKTSNHDHELFKVGKTINASLKLIGFFIGDGHAGGTLANGISFHLKKSRKITYLRRICEEGEFQLTEGKSNQFIVHGTGFRDLFRSHFYDGDGKKIIPEIFMDMTQLDALALIDGLINSDGAAKRKTFEYSSNSVKLINAIQIIGLHAGYAVNINKPQNELYRLMFLANPGAVINQGAVNTSWVDYDGYVYCAKTRTGILVVRRNGKIVLSGNTTPTEMVELKFHCCMPMFIARQWIRHRTANVNEYSGRYSLMPMLFYTPPKDQFQRQTKTNNQGRDGALDETKYKVAVERWNQLRDLSQKLYEDLTSEDVARELARIDLPLSTYTQWYWKIDLHNLLHFLTLRVDSHAQWEIRQYGEIMAGMLKLIAPLSYEAWIDYDVCGTRMSRMEMDAVRDMLKHNTYGILEKDHLEKEIANFGLGQREVSELLEKLQAKPKVDFNLDLATAKAPEFFEEQMNAAVPKIDKT